jgi:hypothetical protein
MRRLALVTVVPLLFVAGCSSRPPPRPPLAPSAVAPGTVAPVTVAPVIEAPALPFARAAGSAHGPLPLSIERILSEERRELHDIVAIGPVGDSRGSLRAATEISSFAGELVAIEDELRASASDSDRLDDVVTRLQRLATRIELLHDDIRLAAGPTTAVEVDRPAGPETPR